MSRYEEMRQTVSEAIQKSHQYQQRSYQNLTKLLHDFKQYCEIPPESFLIIPADKKPEQTQYNVPLAANFEDGFWCVGMLINLVGQRVKVKICIREQQGKGKLVVKLGNLPGLQEIDPADQKQREEFFDRIVDVIKRFYSGADQPEDSEIKQIGFN